MMVTRKKEISENYHPPCYQEIRNVSFRKILRDLFPCNHRFAILPFAMLPTIIKY